MRSMRCTRISLAELGATLDLGDKFVSHVVADGRLVTGQNPQSSRAVAETLVEVIYSGQGAQG